MLGVIYRKGLSVYQMRLGNALLFREHQWTWCPQSGSIAKLDVFEWPLWFFIKESGEGSESS